MQTLVNKNSSEIGGLNFCQTENRHAGGVPSKFVSDYGLKSTPWIFCLRKCLGSFSEPKSHLEVPKFCCQKSAMAGV